MEGGREGEGAQENPGFLIRNPEALGLLVGLGLPLAGILPWWASGDLAVSLADQGAYPLMLAFATLLLPALPIGAVVARSLATGRAFAAFTLGALATASALGAVLVWVSYPEVDAMRRLLIALSGGPAVVGFWVWVGLGVGGVVVFQRRDR